jgi:hypothetical protein
MIILMIVKQLGIFPLGIFHCDISVTNPPRHYFDIPQKSCIHSPLVLGLTADNFRGYRIELYPIPPEVTVNQPPLSFFTISTI